MSSLRPLDLNVIAELVEFIRGPGYVLHFSDSTFSQFFATELDVDIDDARYSDLGGSKGKRLRRYLQLVDDQSALKCLKALWEHRADHVLKTGSDPVPNAEARYLAMLNRIGGSPAVATPQEPPKPAFNTAKLDALKVELLEIAKYAPQPRGYAFEDFLQKLFLEYRLKPREPFKNRGEQIDGSFLLGGDIYLLEARWQNERTSQGDLLVLEGKLTTKAAWARGLFVSYNGFTQEGLEAFGRGRRSILMDGADIYEMLNRYIPFDHVIDRKARRAAESGWPFEPVRNLF